jgi:sarcosine oxidase/L-pipecolate oxidase
MHPRRLLRGALGISIAAAVGPMQVKECPVLLDEVKALNGKVLPGMNVTRILRKGGQTSGVQCSDGTVFDAALVVLAAGSWTPSAFPELDLGRICLATG